MASLRARRLLGASLLAGSGCVAAAGCAVEPARVLLRERHTGVMALDGLTWSLQLSLAAQRASPALRESLYLESDGAMTVERESSLEVRLPSREPEDVRPGPWRLDPTAFEFLVSWEVDWQEENKRFPGQALEIAVRETWEVERVADPAVARNWTCSYRLDGGGIISLRESAAGTETERVVAPSRGPILEEIRGFIAANRRGRLFK